jgi:hypothetical protein
MRVVFLLTKGLLMGDPVKAHGVLNRIIPVLLAGKTFLVNNKIATATTGGEYEQSSCNA